MAQFTLRYRDGTYYETSEGEAVLLDDHSIRTGPSTDWPIASDAAQAEVRAVLASDHYTFMEWLEGSGQANTDVARDLGYVS